MCPQLQGVGHVTFILSIYRSLCVSAINIDKIVADHNSTQEKRPSMGQEQLKNEAKLSPKN